jgi:hypothetical protein
MESSCGLTFDGVFRAWPFWMLGGNIRFFRVAAGSLSSLWRVVGKYTQLCPGRYQYGKTSDRRVLYIPVNGCESLQVSAWQSPERAVDYGSD